MLQFNSVPNEYFVLHHGKEYVQFKFYLNLQNPNGFLSGCECVKWCKGLGKPTLRHLPRDSRSFVNCFHIGCTRIQLKQKSVVAKKKYGFM